MNFFSFFFNVLWCCLQDGKWGIFHYVFAVISPIPMAAILTLTVSGWSGFYSIYMGKLPLFAFLVLLGERERTL